MQQLLIPISVEKDIVRTQLALAQDMIAVFNPRGFCLDPCAGDGVFYNLLPPNSDWCEILKGRDFYAWHDMVDWIIGNPPYSHYSAWLRHSMRVARHIVYLMPVYKVFSSGKFLDELFAWGGIVHIRRYGTGTQWGFPFGHALAAVYYRAGYDGPTLWSRYKSPPSEINNQK